MFAICEYGFYEEYGVICIEISEVQKELFERYCIDSKKIGGSDGESIEIKGYSNLDYRNFVNEIDKFDINFQIRYMTIEEHQEMCRKTLEYIPVHGNHYLQKRIIDLKKLLEYNFSNID